MSKKTDEHKKAQATFFVIIGLVIVVAVFLIGYYYTQTSTEFGVELTKETDLPFELLGLRTNVQSCVEDVFTDGMFLVGLQGGFIVNGESILETEEGDIAYGYSNGKNTLSKVDQIEKELSDYVSLLIPICTNLEEFNDFELEYREPTSQVDILGEEVNIRVSHRIIAKAGESSYTLDEPYTFSLPIRFSNIYTLAQGVIARTANDPETIDISYLLDSELDVDVFTLDDGNVVYSITDEESKVDNVAYTFVFATKV